ncbi:MAG: tetrahydromethanopterin S-methyltransferase subunit C [Methanomicrobiales archaeon]|jgi:tetrahydromethanopterin S-methyltransferase subunit C|nr:tetrahydromethanopterin S-methyltransferase subunit C [Methanomicrobiales archaeon]
MTVKIEVIQGGVPHNTILVKGLVASLVFIYLTYLNTLLPAGSPPYFAFFGGLAAVAALWWGSHTIKHLCSYGIGTGVPSAGMMSFGSGVIAMLLATQFGVGAPIVAVVLAAVIGAILGFVANNVLGMKIPVMIQSIIEMAIIGALVLMGLAALMTGGFTFQSLVTGASLPLAGILNVPNYMGSVIGGCLLAVAFMLGGIAIQHPFNACLGPNWTQDRMLILALECGFLSMLMAAIMSIGLIDTGAALISVIIAFLGWIYTYDLFFKLAKRDAAAWLDSKPIPEVEGH